MAEKEATTEEESKGGTGRPEEIDPSDFTVFAQRVNADLKKKGVELEDLKDKIGQAKKDLERHEKDLEKQKRSIPEIVGLFSAIIAIILIDVSIIRFAPTFLGAILLIAALTCSVAIFAWLIHLFFAPDDKVKFKACFIISIIVLIVLIVIGIIFYSYGSDLYKYKIEERDQGQKQIEETNLPEKNFNESEQEVLPSSSIDN